MPEKKCRTEATKKTLKATDDYLAELDKVLAENEWHGATPRLIRRPRGSRDRKSLGTTEPT